MKNIAVVSLILLGTQCVSAEIFKWTDAQGKIHFSDTRPSEGSVNGLRSVDAPSGRPTLREYLDNRGVGDLSDLPEKERVRLYWSEREELEIEMKQISKALARLERRLRTRKWRRGKQSLASEYLREEINDTRKSNYSLKGKKENLYRKYKVPRYLTWEQGREER